MRCNDERKQPLPDRNSSFRLANMDAVCLCIVISSYNNPACSVPGRLPTPQVRVSSDPDVTKIQWTRIEDGEGRGYHAFPGFSSVSMCQTT